MSFAQVGELFSDCRTRNGADHLLHTGRSLTAIEALHGLDESRIHDALNEVHGDFGDGIHHSGQGVEPHQGFHLFTGFARGVGLHTVIEQHLASSAGDQFEEFHFRFVWGWG